MRWATWRTTLAFIAVVLVLRIVYLVFLCPYELVIDEAQYWDWSRRTELSYATKGPAIAYTIRAARTVLGNEEWAVRLPATLFAAVLMLAAAAMARRLAGGDDRAGFVAAAVMVLMPGYAATALLMTIDGPMLACWAVAAWAGWRAYERSQTGRSAAAWWVALGLVLCIGLLFKYTTLFLLVGIAAFVVIRRREVRWTRGNALGVVGAAAVVVAGFLPVVIWNAQRGWPTVTHLFDALGTSRGDASSEVLHAGFNPIWTLELIGAQIGLVGPALLVMAGAVWSSLRPSSRTDARWPARQYMILAAAPVLVFYFVISLFAKAQGNWPLAGYVTLGVLAAPRFVQELDRRFPHAWRATVIYGVVAGVGMLWLNVLAGLPVVGKAVPYHRFSGNEERAAAVAEASRQIAAETGTEPMIIAAQYRTTALLAYYMPGQPRVFCASSWMGGRTVAYDFFEDVDLTDPELHGRDAILVDDPVALFDRALRFERLQSMSTGQGRSWAIHVGYDYQGVKRDAGRTRNH